MSEPRNPTNEQAAGQNDPPTSSNRILNQQQEIPTANVGGAYTDTKIFKWEIPNVMALPQKGGEYEQSEIFSSKGPYGQPDVKWALRLFPRGKKRGIPKNGPMPVPVSLQLLDGNGSNYVKVDWKLAILNEKGTKVNEREQKSCLYDLESDTHDAAWVFDNFMTRQCLDKHYIVDGHKLILHSEICVKAEKDLQAELVEKTEQAKNLKRKLESKEEENGKLSEDFEQCQKQSRTEISKLQNEKSDLEKHLKNAEDFSKLQRQHVNRYKAEIAKLNGDHSVAMEKIKGDHLAAIEKFKKEEQERCAKLRTDYDLQLKRQQDSHELDKHRLTVFQEAHSNLRAEYDRKQKNHRAEILQLEKNYLLALEKCRSEGEERTNQMCWDYEQRLKNYGEEIRKHEKNKLELQGKCDKLTNFFRSCSKLVDEMNDDENASA